MDAMTLTLEQRFLSHSPTIEADGCWTWPLAPNPTTGYGLLWFNRKNVYAHRAAYSVRHGPIPEGQMVRHSCDNRVCVNPEHLSLGGAQDNVNDMVSRGRQARGSVDGNAKLTEEDVLDIRARAEESATSLSRQYGVSRQTIYHIRQGRTWSHLTVDSQ